MTDFVPLGDPTSMTMAFLTQQFPDAWVASEEPADTSGKLPVIEVNGIGGVDRALTLTLPNIDVYVYEATDDACRLLANEAYTAMLFGLRRGSYDPNGATVNAVRTIQAPRPIQGTDYEVVRYVFTVQLTIRSRKAGPL